MEKRLFSIGLIGHVVGWFLIVVCISAGQAWLVDLSIALICLGAISMLAGGLSSTKRKAQVWRVILAVLALVTSLISFTIRSLF